MGAAFRAKTCPRAGRVLPSRCRPPPARTTMASILVIDDEKSVRYSFRYIFEEEKVQVLSAATAAMGLDLFRRHAPDVVVLDLHLPDRSGLEVFQDIQAQDRKRPVIFITAHGTTDTAIEAM